MDPLVTASPLPRRACPLCGKANDCAPAACGAFRGDCWCEAVTINAEALARVPAEAKGKACLCRACASGRSAEQR